ncbi:hypothetical protein M408DRAFT_170345 [Serendipita vermifera MAFF 305830]|uniref:Uncharacterized protein n=1 Tax=Serendipita vermifera MAFF 305830 TaxID=933852 RepID=A0A0C2W025_SERVB|nr:hypothetical protein M408DRAFT_170345 [Serendipita vermifera MAFF 305830]
MGPSASPHHLYICVACPTMIKKENNWKALITALVYSLRMRRGMKGGLVYCSGVHGYPPEYMRIYQLTHYSDYEILLENSVVSPYVRSANGVDVGLPLNILAWDPAAPLHFESGIWKLDVNKLSRISAWRYDVSKVTCSPISATEQFLDAVQPYEVQPGLSPDYRTLRIDAATLSQALEPSQILPSHFPPNFIPTGLAVCVTQGWIGCLRGLTPRLYTQGDETRVIWEAESIAGRNCDWMECERPSPDQLTLLPPYQSEAYAPRLYLRGWSFGTQVYREIVEVHPSDVIDKDPIQRFFVPLRPT